MTTETAILVAIGPAVVVVPLVLAGVIAGLARLFRKKELPPGPSVATAPFLDMRAGTTTGHLKRNGNTWQWSLAGASTLASSDADAGKAATAMAAALASAEPDAPITGSAGAPEVTTVDFGVQGDDTDGWDWSVTTASKLPAIGDKPAPPTMVGAGSELQRGVAILRALARVATRMPWLDVADPGGKEAGGLTAPVVKPGIVIAGNAVAVTDLPTWIAYAAPMMREQINSGRNADEIMDAIVADLPENATLSGKSIADVRKSVQKLLDMLHHDNYVVVASPDDELAAYIVGATWRPAAWRASAYKGYVILVRPVQAGNPNMGDAEWLVWEGGSRGYDDDAIHRGVMPRGKTLAQAERWAKQQIDQDFPEGTGDAGGNKSAQAAPYHAGVAGTLAPTSSPEAYMPAVKHIDLGARMWSKTSTYDVPIFDFAKKDFYAFKHWKIVIGACMRPKDSKYPFGALSKMLEDGEVEQLPKIRLVNSDVQQHAIGPAPAPDWSSFRKPLLWKGQFEGMVHAGPTIAVEPFDNITGTGAGETVDPCPDDLVHWPVPSNPDFGFYVLPQGATTFVPWKPAPTVELVTDGTKVIARFHVRGFPVFLLGAGGVGYAQAAVTTKLNLAVQIWAAGTNEAP